jgi:hypothetical protein
MTFIGNLLLAIAALAYLALLSTLYGKEPPKGGDYAVGYFWSLLILNALFIIAMVLASIIIGIKGGFEWVLPGSGVRFIFITLCLLAALATTALSSMFRNEPGNVPRALRFFANITPVIIPMLLLVGAVILLNQIQVPATFYKWPLQLAAALGLIGITAGIALMMVESNSNRQATHQHIIEANESNHRRMLEEIDSCDLTKNMVFLLVFTDANQHRDVRDKALAKIKSRAGWQDELVEKLQNDWAPEVFTFLASNEPDDPQLFAAPIQEGILIQAKLIRESIRRSSHPSHFYAGRFLWEVERVLRTVERFSNNGTDYRPALKALRAALDEPSGFEKTVVPVCKALLDKWIKEHS